MRRWGARQVPGGRAGGGVVRGAAHGPLTPSHFYDATVEEYARREPQLVRIEALLAGYGAHPPHDPAAPPPPPPPEYLIRSAEWLRQELPVRIARALRNFQNQPYVMARNPHIHELYDRSWHSFTALRQVRSIGDVAAADAFTAQLAALLARSEDGLRPLARGVAEVRPVSVDLGLDPEYLDTFVDRFLMQRLSRRILAQFHIALHNPRPGWVGIFNLHTALREYVDAGVADVSAMATAAYGSAPEVEVTGDVDLRFASCPFILEKVLREVLKNAVCATMERSLGPAASKPPAPRVIVRLCEGDAATIVVMDNGGGLPSPIPRRPLDADRPLGGDTADPPELTRGWGLGLPISHAYSRYLGGDLHIAPIDGHGTNVYITMPRLDSSVAKEGRHALHMNRKVWECGA